MRSFVRCAATFVLAASVATCSDSLSAPGGRSTGTLRLAFQPHYSPAASSALAALSAAGLSVDRVRVVLVRPPADTLKDTTAVFPAGVDLLPLELTVAASPGEVLSAGLGYYSGTTLMFTGTAAVTVLLPGTQGPATPPVVEVVYAGPDVAATRLAISPASGIFGSLTPVQFTAQALDASNAVVPNVPIVWSTSNAAIATISAAGLLQFTGTFGNVVVTATTPKGLTGSATVGFGSLAPATIAIAPSSASLPSLGDLRALSAVVRDQFGNVVARAPTWTSRTPAIATVAANGTVQAVANGSTYVVASAGAARDSMRVVVRQLVDTLILSRDTLKLALADTGTVSATALDRNRNVIADAVPTYASTNTLIATVSPAGLVTLVGSGTASVVASAGGRSSTAVVMQGQSSVGITVGFAYIRITPGSGSLRVGTSTQLVAEYVDAAGKATPVTPQWASSDPVRAPVSAVGILLPVDTTTVTITATSNGVVGHATFSVLPAPTLSAFSFAPLALAGASTSAVQFSASVSAAEPGGGIAAVTVSFTGPAGAVQSCTATKPIQGLPANGTWSCAISIPAGLASVGVWSATSVTLVGSISRLYDQIQLATYGVTTLTVAP